MLRHSAACCGMLQPLVPGQGGLMSILAVLQVAQAYHGPHNVMSPLPSRMLVDDRYATMACQQRLVC